MKLVAYFQILLLAVSVNVFSDQTKVSEIDNGFIGRVVTIEGTVIAKRDLDNGNISMTVEDSSGVMQAVIFKSLRVDSDKLSVGTSVKVTGRIKEYKGLLELQPREANDIRILYRAIGRISSDAEGAYTTIEGTVVSKYVHPEGHLFLTVSVHETEQEIQVRLFEMRSSFPAEINAGDLVKVTGKVSLYKGDLQIIAESQRDISVVSRSGEKSKAGLISLEDLERGHRGQFFQVKVYVKSIFEHEGHTFMVLRDYQGSGEINAVLFRADTEEIYGRKLKLIQSHKGGNPVRLLVSVDVFKGELQLIVDKVFNEF